MPIPDGETGPDRRRVAREGQDFDALKAAEGDHLEIVGTVVMSRDADGKADVLEIGDKDVADAVDSRGADLRTSRATAFAPDCSRPGSGSTAEVQGAQKLSGTSNRNTSPITNSAAPRNLRPRP